MFEEQKNTIANQHGLEGDSPELHQILTDMENRINEYIVHGALLKCTKGTHENRGILINGKEIQSDPIRVEENSRIRIVENRKATINGLTPASIEDCKGGMRDAKNNLELNIVSFGNCTDIDIGENLNTLITEYQNNHQIYGAKEIEDAIVARKGTCYCFMNLESEWENLATLGEYITGETILPTAGIESIFSDQFYLKFNDKEGINMLSSLYCKFGKGIITAQESGQVESMAPDEDLYRFIENNLIDIVKITDAFDEQIEQFKAAYLNNQERYKSLAEKTGVPPELLALIHYRENTNDYFSGTFGVHLHNGQELGKTTTVYPVGICFYDFDTAAVDAMKGQQSNINQFNLTADSQDLVAMLCFAECYNGKGYYNKGRNSPYIYSGTNLYTKGKYVEKKDENGKTHSVYEPELVDQQVGAYVLLSSLMEE